MAYKHFSSNERFYLEQRLSFGDSVYKIAKELGRHKSSLYNEINRNTDQSFGFYSGLRADNIAKERQALTVRKQKFFANVDKKTMELINTEFKVRSSPDQISAKLKNDLHVEVSQQTIYRHVWCDRDNGGKLYEDLRRRGKKYRIKSAKKETIKNKQSIEKRALFNVLEKEIGHYEIDTIFGLDQKSFLLTIVDIATKYTIIRKIPNKEALTVYNEMKNVFATTLLPFKSITSDNGTEFAEHVAIAKAGGIDWYFCHPYSSWERGLNENTNGLIRDFYQKRTDFRLVPDKDIIVLQNILNNRLRKKLNYQTPSQAMVKHMMAIN